MKQLTLLLSLLTLNSCTKPTKTLTFDFFTIEVPKTWKAIKNKGIDSYVGQIALDEKDTLSFDLGWYSNELDEFQEEDIAGKKYYLSISDTSGNLMDSLGMEKARQSDVAWDTIDKRRVKIIKPRLSGKGITGLYIDSLWIAGSGVDKFEINGRDLKPENERLFLTALKTLRFNDPKKHSP